MKNIVLQTDDGKRIVLSADDVCLYASPVNPPNTGTEYTEGRDLYVHRARSGNLYFYFYVWSLWQGVENYYELCTREQAEQFLLRKAAKVGWEALKPRDFERAKEYGFALDIETA